MIQVCNMTYAYEKGIPVLHDITLMEHEPVIMGLWGRNGAGKTTLMKLLAGHMQPDGGDIKIMGKAPYNDEKAVQHICYMQEEHPFSNLWSIHDALHFSRYFNPNWDQNLAASLLNTFKLDAKKKVSKLSKGMKSALHFIIGLASQASITILDEPINGLDAGMRKKLYEALLESHGENPRLIMLSTHHIEELQALLESLVVLVNGRLLFYEPMDKVREKGVWIAGKKKNVEQVITGQRVLEKSKAGSLVKILIDAPFSSKWRALAHTHGLSVEKARMQDYLLNITSEGEVPA